MKTVLTIAGSDSIGGAGIQADIKTVTLNGAYAMSVITALTAQNTTGVFGILKTDEDFTAKQINAVFEDIFPDAVKIGMIPSKELVLTVSERLKHYGAKNIVTDPVMVSASGGRLMEKEAAKTFAEMLFPISALITPNIPEAEILCGEKIKNEKDMENAAQIICEKYSVSVLLKGGHSVNDSNDFFFSKNKKRWFCAKRIDNPNTHGTGCTLSSAVAANLAKGYDMESSIEKAKEYISGALCAMLDLGKGSGPLNHGFKLTSF